MQCIFCLNDRPESLEHVFPMAIGGSLTTDRVCEPCNSELGSRVDAALSDSFIVRQKRAELKLAGNSGVVPSQFEMLLGEGTLADGTGRRIRVSQNEKTGKLDLRALYHAKDIVTADGVKSRQIFLDARDKAKVPNIIQRERKRHGLAPLNEAELAAEVRKSTGETFTIDQPQLTMQLRMNFSYLRHALFKIAYELAFLWLGESYLDDPRAAELRVGITSKDSSSTDNLDGWAGDVDDCPAFNMWLKNSAHHLAFAHVSGSDIAIAVRIFDAHAAVVVVTHDATRYLRGVSGPKKIRFLAIDSVSGALHDVPFMVEALRIAQRMRVEQRLPHFDDPLG
jgi:HNH endonuclease